MESLKTYGQFIVEGTSNNIKYRSDNYNGVYYKKRINPIDVIENEIVEFGNTDIPDTINSKYFNNSNEDLSLLTDVIMNVDNSQLDAEDITNTIIKSLKEATGKDIKYMLWLADKDVVKSMYDGTDDDILAFDVTDAVIVSDLGRDGILYGFEKLPEPINN